MKGKHLAIGLLVALFGLVGVVFYFGATGDAHRPGTTHGRDSDDAHVPAASVGRAPGEPGSVSGSDGGTPDGKDD